MSQTIKVPNFSPNNIVERTQLAADAAIGVSTVTVEYSDNIANGNYLYIGRLGSESGEVRTVSGAPASQVVTLSAALAKAHIRFDDVCTLFGNSINVYRAPNVDGTQPADGSFTLLTTITIDYDQPETSYTDAAGSSSYWYKYTYYNSALTVETALADSLAVRGGQSVYCSLEDVRREGGFLNNFNILDATVDLKRRAAQQLINGQLNGIYTLPFADPVSPYIRDLTARIAGSLLAMEQFDQFSSAYTTGKAKYDSAVGELGEIKSKKTIITDANGSSLSLASSATFRMWPDKTTAETDGSQGGGERLFRMSDKF
jgi:hypothetical protein